MAINNNPALKRLLTEYKNLNCQPETEFVASPCNDDLFLWHFTIKGQKGTPFEGGIYHGKIVFPARYPLAPPDIYFFTPNGRFETNTKICFSITSFHPDTWNPAWDVRTALLSIIAFMPTNSNGAIGGIDETDEVRRELAIKSREWTCSECSLKIEPDDIPISSDEKLENKNDDDNEDSINKNLSTDNDIDNAEIQHENDEIIEEEEEVVEEEEEIIDDEDDNKELNSNKMQENEYEYDVDNQAEGDQEQEDFFVDLQNINFEELYAAPEISLNYTENINNNNNNSIKKSDKGVQLNNEDESLQKIKYINYETLLENSKNNKQFVFFPYLEIPIFIIFCILLKYTYKFHSC